MRLREGESNLLAGLVREEDRKVLRGVPGLMRIPILKDILGGTEETILSTDIVMLLTPRIVRTHELTQEHLESDLHRFADEPRAERPGARHRSRSAAGGPAGARGGHATVAATARPAADQPLADDGRRRHLDARVSPPSSPPPRRQPTTPPPKPTAPPADDDASGSRTPATPPRRGAARRPPPLRRLRRRRSL